MENKQTVAKRRFTCLTPRLVRLEFSPDGTFEDHRSLVAHAPQQPQPFHSVRQEDGATVLSTGELEIFTREDDRAFFPLNLEVRWLQAGLQQYWRPQDRDHANLGGTFRSLDRYDNSLKIHGVHVADGQSPDTMAAEWIAWLQCEDDPPYYERSPRLPAGANEDLTAAVRFGRDTILERTRNAVRDAHRFAPGVLSRSGYFVLNDSLSPLIGEAGFPLERNRPGYQDWYFFAYGQDYKAALQDFALLTGQAPLPPKHVFGLQYSRWPAFGEVEAKQICADFRARHLPLSTLIVDMEWHREGWGHWDWNEELYPAPKKFFDWCHEQDLAVVLNDHPLNVRSDDSHFETYLEAAGTHGRVQDITYDKKTLPAIEIDMGNARESNAFVEVCHRPISSLGLDYWWNDGCRGKLNGAHNQLLANKLFWEEMSSPERRGMLLARYAGLGSHRYGVFFTGDTLSCWEVLEAQCEFNIRAGGVGLAYVSHDIGGFYTSMSTPLLDPQLYLRWVQFGAMSPIFRFHSAPGSGSRLPWDYGETYEKAALKWIGLRHSLQPHIYTAARTHHDTGLPIVRGLYLEHPHDDACYRFDQYYLGDGLLLAPVLSAERYRSVYLPAGNWWELDGTARHTGGRESVVSCNLNQVPAYVRAGTILVRQPPEAPASPSHIENLLLSIYPGASGCAQLYEDDGQTPGYTRDEFCRTVFQLQDSTNGFELSARVTEGTPLRTGRNLTIEFSRADTSPQAPRSARFRGQDVAIETLGQAGRFRIELGAVETVKPWTLIIEN